MNDRTMGATFAVRHCISQRLSTNSCSRIPASVTILQNRIHFSRAFSSSTLELCSVLPPMSSSCCSFSSSGSSTSVNIKLMRLRGLRSGGRGDGVPVLRNAAALVTTQCRRSFDLSSRLSFSCWKKTQSSVPKWKRLLRGSRTECCSQAGSNEQSPSMPSSVLPSVETKTPGVGLRITFCPRCGGATERKIPDGEHELRVVCTVCSAVHYENPKMVVGCLVEHEDQILLCKRSIEPSYGYWTLPAGYMEIGESAAEGAARETWEEACAEVEVVGLFAHLDIPFIGQSYIIFRAQLRKPHFSPGPESLECALFKLEEIPFDRLAFSSIGVALKLYVEDVKSGTMRVHHGVIDKRPGAALSDPAGFLIRNHLCS